MSTKNKAKKLILHFREIGISDVSIVGGKNASLGEMIREHEAFSLLGSTYLLLASLLAIEIFPQPIAAAALGFTVLGDAFGALVGRAWGRHRILNKSLEGALGCLLAWLGWIGVVGYAINACMLRLQQRVARRMGAA